MNNHDFIEACLFIEMSKQKEGFAPTPQDVLEEYIASRKT